MDTAAGREPRRDSPGSGAADRFRLIRTLRMASRAQIYIHDEAALLSEICRIVVVEGGHRLACIGYADNGDVRTLRPVARAGGEPGSPDETWPRSGAAMLECGPAMAALRSGKTVYTGRDLAAGEPQSAARGCLACPLIDEQGGIFGVFVVYSAAPGAFISDEARSLEELAGDLALSVAAIRFRASYRQAEDDRRSHLQFLQGLDRVNRAIQEAADPEQMMRDVLETVLALFQCDRAYLLYPCDPQAPEWRVPMECTTPEHPGALALGLVFPMSEEVANVFRTLLASDGPLRYGPGNEHQVPSWQVLEPYSIRSFMAMAIRPKLGKPWQFGIHQCSRERAWTTAEAALLQEIGRRIADGLTSLLTQRDLKESEMRLHTLVQTIPDLVCLKDPDGAYLRCNPQAEDFLGVGETDVIGKTDHDFLEPELADSLRACDLKAMETGGRSVNEEWLTFASNGYRGLFETVRTPMRDPGGKLVGVVSISRDITSRKAAEQEVEHLAYHDALTGLPNRRLLRDRLRQALAASARSHNHGALLFIDLDNFKVINDTAGHETGDRLLLEVASRLVSCVRENDTVARLGGDEFVVMLEGLKESANEAAAQAIGAGEKIRALLNQPYALGGRTHHSSPSIGIALFCGTAESADELLKQADIAMYQAKSAGRNTLRFFDPQMQANLAARASLESALRQAIQDHQFVLHYQPQVDGSCGIVGAEALLRWSCPGRGLVSPGEFLTLAEESGLILSIGRWVLESACSRLTAWADSPRTRDLHLAVNISARQFRQADFVEQVKQTLAVSGAPAARLKLELTETLVVNDVTDTIGKMQALREVGVGFSMDDFGMGYSSMAHLIRMPLDQIKVDRSFIHNLPGSGGDAMVVQGIIGIAKSLGLVAIAEGVENEAQREFLERNACSTWQGFMFGRPMEIEAFERMLPGA